MNSIHMVSMRWWRSAGLSAVIVASSHAAISQAAPGAGTPGLAISIGRSVVPLNGPWRFHTGDDLRWADPVFDAAAWESVDLTPAAGAHDPDVGLVGYVPGWGARGHPSYAGYAWYRLKVVVDAPRGTALAIAGPLEVNDAYQLFLNGRLVGGSGRFDRTPPVVYNTRPELFVLHDSIGVGPTPAPTPVTVAVRVWMGAGTARASRDAGGMRIAPAIGELGAVRAQHRLAWLTKFLGYVVEIVEAAAFTALAVLAGVVAMSDRSRRGYGWLIAGLLLVGLLRANQAFFFWTPWESARVFLFIRHVVLTPLALGAWTMVWRSWSSSGSRRVLPAAIAVLTGLYALADMLAVMAVDAAVSRPFSAAVRAATTDVRLAFLGLTLYLGFRSLTTRPRISWLASLAMTLMCVGLYAQELSSIGVPGIWFPFGVGVSRTQFAFAAFFLIAFGELLRRQFVFTRERRLVSPVLSAAGS